MKDRTRPIVYIACPCGPVGGGMYRLADYLIQSQSEWEPARLQALDTRGQAGAAMSVMVLTMALGRILAGRLSGRLRGVHVNMAERLSVFRKGAVVLFARALGLPVVLHLHAAQMPRFYRRLPAPLQVVVRRVFARASTVLVLGPRARAFVVDELGVPPDKVQVLLNGVPRAPLARRTPRQGEPFRIVFVGNLLERKGVTDLLHALARLRADSQAGPWLARFAGGGDVQHYRAMTQALGLDGCVEFTGWAEQGEVAQLLAAADVLVLPSHDEGLPLAILEALSHGTAVICTPVGEIPALLRDGVHARFVPVGNVEALSSALVELMRQPALREQLELGGRQLYDAQFSVDAFAARLAAVHRRCFDLGQRLDQ